MTLVGVDGFCNSNVFDILNGEKKNQIQQEVREYRKFLEVAFVPSCHRAWCRNRGDSPWWCGTVNYLDMLC
jgi:hypothetical protein